MNDGEGRDWWWGMKVAVGVGARVEVSMKMKIGVEVGWGYLLSFRPFTQNNCTGPHAPADAKSRMFKSIQKFSHNAAAK